MPEIGGKPMEAAMEAVYKKVQRGALGPTDVILQLRNDSIAEQVVRRAIWELVSSGRLMLNGDRNLMVVA